MRVGFGRRRVADVEDNVRHCGFLESGLERFDKSVRKPSDKSYRVNQHNRNSARELERPRGRVERRKELVLRQHSRVGQIVHKRAFARVRVADNRDGDNAVLLAALSEPCAVILDLFELFLERFHTSVDVTAVCLELCFARTSCADTAAETRQLNALARKSRQKVLELGELDLELAFL